MSPLLMFLAAAPTTKGTPGTAPASYRDVRFRNREGLDYVRMVAGDIHDLANDVERGP